MHRIFLSTILFGATAFAGSTASAQSLKPGLWETTNRMQSSSGQMEQGMAQMQQQMASMPPEQRKMVEDMMKQRGMSMGQGSGGAMSVKFCMSKEMAEHREIPAQRGDCKMTQQQLTGSTMKMAFTCTNPPSSGEGQVTFSGSDAYQMKMVVNTTAQGRPEKVNMEGSGRYLGPDCGDIKPMRGK